MAQARPRWRRRIFLRHSHSGRLPHPRTLFCLAIFTILTSWVIVPYDNTVRLATRWNLQKLWSILLPSRACEEWVFAKPPAYPVNLSSDTLVIVKTGYGTRHRVDPWFEALTFGNNNTATNPIPSFADFLLIADFSTNRTTHVRFQDKFLPIHDVVGRTLTNRNVLLNHHPSHPRMQKYREFQEAISSGNDDLAMKLSRSSGWELDALKFLSGLELAYQKFPSKRWYILADDDTYLVRSSLLPLLSHLDSSEPHYLGNAVGDFRARFAHGGSSVVLSQGAMRALLLENPKKLARGQVESLDEIWGDRLLAKALIRVGVFLEEKYSRLFNGEGPKHSRVREDRLCSPVVAFHGLANGEEMLDTGRHFGNVSSPVLWGDLWGFLSRSDENRNANREGSVEGISEGARWSWREETNQEGWPVLHGDRPSSAMSYDLKEAINKIGGKNGIRKDWDYIGLHDESIVSVDGVARAEECAAKCLGSHRRFIHTRCLAWTYEAGVASGGSRKMRTGKCYLSPWMVFGQKSEGRSSGVNEEMLMELEKGCFGG